MVIIEFPILLSSNEEVIKKLAYAYELFYFANLFFLVMHL